MANQIESSTNDKPVALVTGANQGVGFQIAKALADNGYIVYAGSRNLSNGEKEHCLGNGKLIRNASLIYNRWPKL